MLSKQLQELFIISVNVSSVFGGQPIKFDRTSGKFRIDKNALPGLRLNYILQIIWSFGATIKAAKLFATNFQSFSVFLPFYAMGIIYQIFGHFIHAYYLDICRNLNGIFEFYSMFQTIFIPHFEPNKSKINLLLDTLLILIEVIGCLGVGLFLSVICILDPAKFFFLGDLIPPEYFTPPVRVALTVYHLYLITTLACASGLGFCMCLTHVVYMSVLLPRELRLGQSNYLSNSSTRTEGNIRFLFISFIVLNENILQIHGHILVWFYGLSTVLPISCFFVLIRYWAQLGLLEKLPLFIVLSGMVIGWLIVCQAGLYLFVNGYKVLNSWKGDKWGSKKKNLEMKRFRVSCKPVVLAHGKQFVIRRVTILLYLKGLTRGLWRVLLTTR